LSDGLSESLINSLSQLPSLKVISRSSAFKYKGKEIDPQQVARDLGVQAIVTGRVIQRGDQLQVSAELVNVSDKTQMWGEQFNRKVTDALAVQMEISQQIAEKLRLRLSNAEQQQLAKDAKVNPQAYEQVLKGRFYRAKFSRESYQKGIEYFNQAIAIDGKYALAYAELAAAYNSFGANGFADPKETTPKAEAAARKALELDEGLPEAHSALAEIKSNAWDWVGAEQEFKRAIELNPNYARAHSAYSALLSTLGRHEQAIAEIKRARELDPLALVVNANIGFRLYFARQYEQAIEQLKKTLEMDQNYGYAHVLLGYTYAGMGRYNEAIAEYETSLRLTGDQTSAQCYLGYAMAKAGRLAEAEAILKKLETTKDYVSPTELTVLYVGLGEKDQALSALERAYAAHDLQMRYLGVDPYFDSLRSEPRFQELIRKVGLPG
jgi:TolB-like protein/Tfp pilus assembly protein PilF